MSVNSILVTHISTIWYNEMNKSHESFLYTLNPNYCPRRYVVNSETEMQLRLCHDRAHACFRMAPPTSSAIRLHVSFHVLPAHNHPFEPRGIPHLANQLTKEICWMPNDQLNECPDISSSEELLLTPRAQGPLLKMRAHSTPTRPSSRAWPSSCTPPRTLLAL
jgi:hypothetical protein